VSNAFSLFRQRTPGSFKSPPGGINAARTIRTRRQRLPAFYDTVKGGDFVRASQCVSLRASFQQHHHQCCQGVPCARVTGGLLITAPSWRAGPEPSTAAGQTGQQFFWEPIRRFAAEWPRKSARCSADGNAGLGRGRRRGRGNRGKKPGKPIIERTGCVSVGHRRYSNVFIFRPTLGCNGDGDVQAYNAARFSPTPATPGPSDMHSCFWRSQSKLTLMSESLRNDGACGCQRKGGHASSIDIPESERDYFLERKYPPDPARPVVTDLLRHVMRHHVRQDFQMLGTFRSRNSRARSPECPMRARVSPLFLWHPHAAVITQGLGHQGQLRLVISRNRNACRMTWV